MKKLVLFAMIAVMIAMTAFAGTDFNLNQDQSQSYNPVHPKRISAGTTATINNDAYTFSTLTSAQTLTLPPILSTSGIYGQVYIISKDTSTWPVTIVASTSDSAANTIEGSASRKLYVPSGQIVLKINTGTDWKVVWETMPVKMNMASGTTTVYGTANILDTAGTSTFGTVNATTVSATTVTAGSMVTSNTITATNVVTATETATGLITAGSITTAGSIYSNNTVTAKIVSLITGSADAVLCVKANGNIGICSGATGTTNSTCTCNSI